MSSATTTPLRYRRLVLQLPQSPLRPHFVKAKVRVHDYPDGTLALYHGPRCLARYDHQGQLIDKPNPWPLNAARRQTPVDKATPYPQAQPQQAAVN